MNRLNVRLLGAFGLVLLLTLAIISLALILVLRARPVNRDAEYLDLAGASLDISSNETQRLYWQSLDIPRRPREQVLPYLETQAAEKNVRILLTTADGTVVWDSAGNYPRKFEQIIGRGPFSNTNRLPRLSKYFYQGVFLEKSVNWLFIEQSIEAVAFTSTSDQATDVLVVENMLVAEPMPKQSFRAIIREYLGSGLFLAFFQAGCIGMVIAFLVSVGIVRWVSRPLLDVAHAAVKVAEGDYATRVPVHGPDEVREVARTFNTMAARVELGQQAQRDFLANVSHDLRTPLTSIQGFAQAIADGVSDDNAHAANIIYHEAGRMTRMVNDLLDLARIQAGRLDMMRQAIEIDELLKTVGESMAMRARDRGLQFDVQIPDLPRIAGDGDRLAQVFTNLVDNAIKHTPAGGRVWLRATLDNQGVLVRVQDTGEGIPREDLPRIFERFYQVDKSRAKTSGTGLGLAITREIVQAHAGRIWVESEYGQGARFNVWLPQPTWDGQKTVVVRK
ncbi:MAG: HAMP domain-containing histidine kinase [Chloroflexi bacterium]|nr:HAMP domain-containing histidine kinase [Chloroflexota bacterium]